jgi:hypothetical protein
LIFYAKTCLSTCLYSITYNSCEFLKLEENTSNERLSFLNIFNEEYIMNKQINNIFVFDRGYYSNDFIENIYKTNNFFICRLKQKLQSQDDNIHNL